MNEHSAQPWPRQYGSIYRFVRRRASTREDAEDLTQEVFEAAIAALGQARLDADSIRCAPRVRGDSSRRPEGP
jgi:DNA-directed RNA polymerase specialized sigma24 family protein